MKIKLLLFCFAINSLSAASEIHPIKRIELVANKILLDAPREYKLKLYEPINELNKICFVDFGMNYGTTESGVAYAISSINSNETVEAEFELSFNDRINIWINDSLVYSAKDQQKFSFSPIERDYILQTKFSTTINKGFNKVLIKSEYQYTEHSTNNRPVKWAVYLRAKNRNLRLSLEDFLMIDSSISKVQNWLIIGSFPLPFENKRVPETKFELGQIYTFNQNNISWTIPKSTMVVENPRPHQPWGEGYLAMNYHAAGAAWAMGELGAFTGENKYTDYCLWYCDFYLKKRPYLSFQKYGLNAFNTYDNKVIDGCLLDYTGSVALPYLFLLNNKIQINNSAEYLNFIDSVKQYVVNKQTRTSEGCFNRITPKKYTIWTDDMYMGLQFLVYSAKLSKNKIEKDKLLNDAVNQVFAFNKYVWHENVSLYQHAQYSDEPVSMPFWSRANGWALWAVADILANLDTKHPLYNKLMKHYKKHVNALCMLQDKKTGFWHNVLDKPDSYEEVSGTAIFVRNIALGINKGWLPKNKYEKYVLLGWKAIDSSILPDGTVKKICVGTNCSVNLQDYYNRPTADNDTHGMLAILFSAIEVQRMVDKK